jgi:hypothetical protein
VRISLHGDTGLDGLVAARDLVQDDAWITVDHVVLPVPTSTSGTAAMTALLESLPFTVPTYLELPKGGPVDAALEVITDDGVERAAFRVGPAEDLAHALIAAVRRSVPFSITGDVSDTGKTPGVLELLAATSRAIDSDDVAEVAELLRSDDVDQLLRLLIPERAGVVRRHLRSVGCAAVLDVYTGMTAIGEDG